jgi:NSS family neurotransmitter:Na+ symporter
MTTSSATKGLADTDTVQARLTISNEPAGSDNSKDKWASNTAFLFASIGAAIGLGNIVRFPFLAFKHGGAAFLIPYVAAWLLVGVPVLGLEFMLGQRMRARGALRSCGLVHKRAWGVGAVAVYAAVLVMITYNMVMSWSWVFLYHSFSKVLPWGTTLTSATAFFRGTVQGIDADYEQCGILPDAPSGLSDGSCGVGKVQPQLVVGLLLQYGLLFLALCAGKKLVGKVVMVTMPLPFLMLTVIFIYALTLEGAKQGVDSYIGKLDTTALANGDAWVDALGQIFFGLSLAIGGMLAYGAAQPSDAPVARNTWVVSLSNSLFSFFSGFAMFMVIGSLAHKQGDTIEQLNGGQSGEDNALGGYSLSFVTFPVALNLLGSDGVGQFFCALFFAMLILLGFDSAMNLIESATAALKDHSPLLARHEAMCVLAVCGVGFSSGLLMCTQGGSVIMDTIDHFSSTYCLLAVGLMECVVVGWVYDLVPLDEEAQLLVQAHNHEKQEKQEKKKEKQENALVRGSSKNSRCTGGGANTALGGSSGDAPCLVGKQCDFVVGDDDNGNDDGDDLESGMKAAATPSPTTTITTTATPTSTTTFTVPITPATPPLLDPSLPLYDRFVTHGLLSSRLQREIATMTGHDPHYLPLAWSLMVKTVTPAIILGLLCYNVRSDLKRHGGDVYTGVFGWGLCCVLPIALLVVSAIVPYRSRGGGDRGGGRGTDADASIADAKAKQQQQQGQGREGARATPVYP